MHDIDSQSLPRRFGAGFLPALKAYGGFKHAGRAIPADETLGRLGTLEVRLARNPAEVRRAQRLRYRVFYKEGAAIADAKTRLSRRDIDAFDSICDHLLVIDHASKDAARKRSECRRHLSAAAAGDRRTSRRILHRRRNSRSESWSSAIRRCAFSSSAAPACCRHTATSAPSNCCGTAAGLTCCSIAST